MNLPAGLIKLVFRYKNINYKLIEIVKQEFNEINSKIYDNDPNQHELFIYNMDIINVKEIKYDGCVCRPTNMNVFNKMKNSHLKKTDDNKSFIITGDFLFKNKIINGKMIIPIRYSIQGYIPYFVCASDGEKVKHFHLNRRGWWTLYDNGIDYYEDHIIIKYINNEKIIYMLYDNCFGSNN